MADLPTFCGRVGLLCAIRAHRGVASEQSGLRQRRALAVRSTAGWRLWPVVDDDESTPEGRAR
jgi:hypothetical protein